MIVSLNLTEKTTRAIVALIVERINEHLARFPFAKYPNEPLEEWKRVFSEPRTVPVETLRQAFRWPLGGWARRSLTAAHSRTIHSIVKSWPEFAGSGQFEPEQVFRFWEQRLPHWQSGFTTVAFLLHLLRPEAFELADAQRISAMRELMKEAGHPEEDQPPTCPTLPWNSTASFSGSSSPSCPTGTTRATSSTGF
jgi:hypothetical protein